MQPRIIIKSELPVGKLTIPDLSTRRFTFVIDKYSLSFIRSGKRVLERVLINFLPLKRGGLLEGGGLFDRVL